MHSPHERLVDFLETKTKNLPLAKMRQLTGAMSKFQLRIALILFAASFQPTLAAEQKPGDARGRTSALPADLVVGLRKGGYVIYFRHAATDRHAADTDRKNLDNCATQRNLSALGRRQAASIGDAFRRLRIPVGKIISSPYCRTMDTARLAFGRVKPSHALIYAPKPQQQETRQLAISLYRLIGTLPKAGTNTVIVGHSVNLYDATRIWPKPEGVALIFKPKSNGTIAYIETVHPNSWQKTAKDR